MPDPYGDGRFGIDSDPMNYPGGETAAATFARENRDKSFIDDRNRNFWDVLLGRSGQQRQFPQASGPPVDLYRNPTDEGRFPPQAVAPPPPQAKPVTKISSGSAIAQRMRDLIRQSPLDPYASAGPPAPAIDWNGTMPPPDTANLPAYQLPGYMRMPYSPEQLAGPPAPRGAPNEEDPRFMMSPYGNQRHGGREFGGREFGGTRHGGRTFGASAPREEDPRFMEPAPVTGPSPYGNQRHGGATFGGYRTPGNTFGGRLFGGETHSTNASDEARRAAEIQDLLRVLSSGSGAAAGTGAAMSFVPPSVDTGSHPYRRADGGPVHLMRGGYPELYNKPVRQGYFATGGETNYVGPDGRGDGRSDHIDAKLSPGEYVIDAETTALLGDGDGEAGARKLDKMRQDIRRQKGKKLAQGDISPKAKKSAVEYLARDPIRDGMRNVGR